MKPKSTYDKEYEKMIKIFDKVINQIESINKDLKKQRENKDNS